ncbi:MAG TPA: acyl-CoA thioesterase [Candidatus Acetatifactor stercoripullorum]|uniref:Acyl-CoA thioesterase n=1 Tax=Candidatus Acetatifactor stercoripullorum TaxID=2838414 RepID=A0A9D1R3R6_9FIRM|nr:hotdog domain-containing protein [Candidatus Acetatifactor stercoripullorum]HIW81141.1 acyl-CoA thioesterase [Candidatus Acetatifactor stercoripullorum]
MRKYETLHLVKGEDLNHHGTLFAARAAAWFVEAGFAAAACEHGNTEEIVLRNVHSMSFSRPVKKGEVVRFTSRVVYAGTTSLVVGIEAVQAITGERAIAGYITFVTVEEDTGRKKAHKVILDAAWDKEEERQRKEALCLVKGRKLQTEPEKQKGEERLGENI